MSDRRPAERLQDILEAIARIEKYAPRFENIETDLMDSLVARQLEIIGEAAYRLPRDLRAAHPEVPWLEIAAVRHIIVHDYWEVDYSRLWKIVSDHLPQLKTNVTQILKDMN